MKKVVKKEEKKELEQAFVLWSRSGKNQKFFTGHDCNGEKLVAFVNYDKKNEKQPDIRVYNEDKDGKADKEVASLWSRKNKNNNGIHYIGSTSEKEYLVAFLNENATEENKQPSIRAYFQEDEN